MEVDGRIVRGAGAEIVMLAGPAVARNGAAGQVDQAGVGPEARAVDEDRPVLVDREVEPGAGGLFERGREGGLHEGRGVGLVQGPRNQPDGFDAAVEMKGRPTVVGNFGCDREPGA